MRRNRFLLLAMLCAMVVITTTASAQDWRAQRTPRAYLVFSEGLGISGGGALTGQSGLSQFLRVSGVVGIRNTHGIELSAIHVREVLPVAKLFDDPILNNPRADGLILSYASLSPQREGGFPSILSIGGGVLRRPTNDPAKDRETWALHVGLESDLFKPPVDWADLSAGMRLLVMPGTNKRQLYVLAVTFGVRLG